MEVEQEEAFADRLLASFDSFKRSKNSSEVRHPPLNDGETEPDLLSTSSTESAPSEMCYQQWPIDDKASRPIGDAIAASPVKSQPEGLDYRGFNMSRNQHIFGYCWLFVGTSQQMIGSMAILWCVALSYRKLVSEETAPVF
ncbi:hypothetical protein CC86DRAFT_382063 [Ophiobolus disseminans]|uniref:Uncharacterized protein n=1 Tax=Ophiobolus disseminans TaxID=1469910 RepID=A0A6A7A1N3_9PLEO|nr:hypothetical protein CC86DRAFT_382063 [Ophiobolus disseminans]